MVEQSVSGLVAGEARPAFYTPPDALEGDERGDEDDTGSNPPTASRLISLLDGTPLASSSLDYAVILDSQVCALRVGWLDMALAPMLRDPSVLVSGPRALDTCDARKPTAACQQGTETLVAGCLAMRLSAHGRSLLAHARDAHEDLPYNQAIAAAAVEERGLVNAGAVSTNPRLLALDTLVDAQWFTDAAYYGLEARTALIHAPRRLRVPGPIAMSAHLADLSHHQPAVVIILPSPHVQGLQSLIKSIWASFIYAGLPRKSVVFIACSRQGLVEASTLLSLQVVMSDPRPLHPDPCTASALLDTAASLAHAGLHSMLLTGLDSGATGSARGALASLMKQVRSRPTIFLQPGEGVPIFVDPASASSPINVGATFISSPRGSANRAGEALSAWASALRDAPLSRPALEAILAPLVTVSALPSAKFAHGGDLRFLTNLQNGDARASKTALVYSTGFLHESASLSQWKASMVFHHRMMGLWNAGPGPVCSTYSAVSRRPILLDGPQAVSRALRLVGRFLAFARQRQLDCAVFPGFMLGGPHGPVVPYDAVLDGTAVRDLAGRNLVLYPRFTDMDAVADGFVPFVDGDSFAEDGVVEAQDWLSPVRAHRRDAAMTHDSGLKMPETVTSDGVLVDASMSRTPHSLLSRSLVRAIQADVQELNGKAYASTFVCVHDDRKRTASETALLAVNGGIGRLATALPRLSSGRPVFVTGPAWRKVVGLLRAEFAASSVAWAPSFAVLTAANLSAQAAGLGMSDDGSLPPSWAPIIEYAACQAVFAATGQPVIDLGSLLPRPLSSASIASRLATHVPPDILGTDLAIFSAWWRRHDRPVLLKGVWARIVLGGEPEAGNDGGEGKESPDGVDAPPPTAPSAIHLAEAVGADLTFMPGAAARDPDGLPQGWGAIIGSGALAAFYRASPKVLPATIGFLLDPAALLDFQECLAPGLTKATFNSPACAGLPLTREVHRESARFLMERRHAEAASVLRRASGHIGDSARFRADPLHSLDQFKKVLPLQAGRLTVLTLAYDNRVGHKTHATPR